MSASVASLALAGPALLTVVAVQASADGAVCAGPIRSRLRDHWRVVGPRSRRIRALRRIGLGSAKTRPDTAGFRT
ncbi:MAG: hypothetical protein R3E87_11250 [Burkholderiaceae bacterium]